MTHAQRKTTLGAIAIVLMVGMVDAGASHGVSQHVSQGAVNGNGANFAFFAGASADGERAFFTTDEVLADTDADNAVDLYERAGGTTTQVSRGLVNGNANANVSFLGASADGTRVLFRTSEQLVPEDVDGAVDIYERSDGETVLISGGSGNVNPEYAGSSVDGTRVLFTTRESLTPDDKDNRLDIYQRFQGQLSLVTPGGPPGTIAEDVIYGGISDDGRHVFWTTFEQILASDDEPTGAALDVYETFNGTTSHVTIGSNAPKSAIWVGNSTDGARVFFATGESYDSANDTDTQLDIYERAGGLTTLVSQGAINGNGSHGAVFVDASADGSRVLFTTFEALAATDNDAAQDVYERAGGTTSHVSQGAPGGNGPHEVFFRGASAEGSHVLFTTTERLAATDSDNAIDLYERVGGTTVHVSQGATGGDGAHHVTFSAVSAEGDRVFFTTTEQLDTADTDTAVDVYERAGGVTSLISRGSQDGSGAGFVIFARVSLDGSHVFFMTDERLAATDTDAQFDVYEAADGPARPPANGAPTAEDDAYLQHGSDTSLVVGAPGVLEGDRDPDSDPLSVLLVDGPSHGTLNLEADGSFTYAPAEDFVGDDAFTYRASDGQATSPPATVTLTVGAGCAGRPATIVGTAASETLHGTPGDDVIVGLDGDDKVNVGDGNDIVCAGGGDDQVNAGVGDDHVVGGSGDDILRGDLGNDSLLGGDGADTLLGDDGNDRLGGGAGSPDTCRGGAGTDVLTADHGCEHVTGVP